MRSPPQGLLPRTEKLVAVGNEGVWGQAQLTAYPYPRYGRLRPDSGLLMQYHCSDTFVRVTYEDQQVTHPEFSVYRKSRIRRSGGMRTCRHEQCRKHTHS